MIKTFGTAAVIFLLSEVILPQTIIRERVEIKPTLNRNLGRVQSGELTKLTIKLSWDMPNRPGDIVVFRESGDCPNFPMVKDEPTPGYEELVIDNTPPGTYLVRAVVNLYPGEISHGVFQIYVGDSLALNWSPTFTGSLLQAAYAQTNFTLSLYSGLSFITTNKVCWHGYRDLSLYYLTDYSNCTASSNYYSDNDIVTLTIENGGEYLSFIKNSDWDHPTDTLKFLPKDDINILVYQDKANYNTQPLYSIIKAEVNGIVHKDSVLLPAAGDFYVGADLHMPYVYPQETNSIYVYGEGDGECGVGLPEDIKFNINLISGTNFGSIYDTATGQRGQSLVNLSHEFGFLEVFFVADGEVPVQPEQAVVRISTTDPSIEPYDLTIYISPQVLKAEFNPGVLNIGELSNVHMTKLLPDGTTQEFPDEQGFFTEILEGQQYATLLEPIYNSSGTEIWSGHDFQILAADSIPDDSVFIKLKINTYDYGPIASAIRDTGNKNGEQNNRKALRLEKIIEKNKRITEGDRITVNSRLSGNSERAGSTQSIKGESGVTGYPGQLSLITGIWIKKAKPELVIISPTGDTPNSTISQEPKMPVITCQAKLKNYTKGNVTFEWYYTVEYELSRVDYPSFNPLCSRFGKSIFSGTTSASGDQITIWEVPFTSSAGKFEFKGEFYKKGGCDIVVNNWMDGEDVFTGGIVNIKVIAKNEIGIVLDSAIVTGRTLLGENPNSESVLNYASPNEFKAIVKAESRTMQFNINSKDRYYTKIKKRLLGSKYSRKGYPIYGPPSGFGLSQLDPNASEKQLWNWKSNIEGGKVKYYDFKKYAENYMKKHPPTIEELLKETYQYYNSGYKHNYYTWDNEFKKWIKNSKITSTYAQDVYKIYLSLTN